MPSRIRHGLLIIITVIGLFFASAITSYAETVNYIYDDLNRLIQVVYDTGTVIQYTYDEVGNRLDEIIQIDATPPTGTILIDSGAAFNNNTSVTLTLSCSDANGCSQMKFSNDNQTYSTPETYATTKVWTLSPGEGIRTVYIKYRDNAGNWSNPIIDNITACSSSSARIGSTSYSTLQAAYNAAGNGNTIKGLGSRMIGNLTVNRNVTVTLEGGYDCGFTTNNGGMTFIKGMVTTTAGEFPEDKHYGVIAEEIELVLPEVVKEGLEKEKGVSYTEIIPVLIEAMKEQQKTIEKQQEEIEELKAATRQLKAGMNKSVASLQP